MNSNPNSPVLRTIDYQKSLEVSKDTDAHTQSVARVLVLYTGGTIGMINKLGGYEPRPNCMVSKLRSLPIFHDEELATSLLSAEERERFFILPRLPKECHSVMYEVQEFSPLLDSSNMNVDDWAKIARIIEENYYEFDGFVVLHGTDTMAYTASALSFMFENLGKPVILTGSQIPIYEVRSDGRDNFLGSLIIAGNYNIPEVMLFFNEKVYRGNRSVKSDTDSFTAFTSPNMGPLVKLEINIRVDWTAVFHSGEAAKFTVQTNMCPNVGVLRLFPGITSQTVAAFLQPPMQGVVLQTYGAGNAPSNRDDIIRLFQEATKWGVLIVNITQCNRGNVNASYATGMALQTAGVIPGGDMTVEAALCKLAYVLGKYEWNAETRRKMLSRNLRGEMTTTPRLESISLVDHDLIDSVARAMSLSTRSEISKLKDALFPTLLCAAAKAADIAAMEQLVSCGANVTSSNHDGRTALHVASGLGNLQAVRFLLMHGASVHQRDHRGDNPLIDAVLTRSMPVIELLVETGAKLPWTSMRIAVLLCSAAAADDVQLIKAWHMAGADMNCSDYDHRTPLHVAVGADNAEVVKLLVEAGAHVNLQDIFGHTPVSIANKLQLTKIVDIFKSHQLTHSKSLAEIDTLGE